MIDRNSSAEDILKDGDDGFQKEVDMANNFMDMRAERDAALERAEKAERQANEFRLELVHVWNLHRHTPSNMLSRIDAVLATTPTPLPTEERTPC